MSILIDLSGKRALVTGSSQGIGAAIARRLHDAGAAVVLNHPCEEGTQVDHDARAIRDALNAQRHGSATIEIADMSDADAVKSMMERVRDAFGGLDILVNNAGILRDRTVAKMTLDQWQAVLNVNLTGVFHGCKFGLEVLRDGGAIVNLGSIAATAGFHGQANYAAAKAGVHALTKVLAKECGKRAIRVNAVAPGVVDTAMMAQVAEDVRAKMRASIPLGRLARADEIAAAVAYLASDMASYVNGAVLDVNGGWFG